MLGKIIGAVIGKRIGDRHGEGGRGALAGAIIPALGRRLTGPLGLALVGGYVAKKIYDRRKRASSGS
jgi:hypothetical protein